jgi:two-component system phosphate regulon response regulator PhoB
MTTERPTRRVLVVDDDAAIRMVCAAHLALAGFEVLEAEDGLRGLERARDDRPELVLLDVRMPGLDGFELAARLRRDEQTRGIPLLFLSGESAPAGKARALALGALDYVTKPFDPIALASLVAGALESATPMPVSTQ